MDRRAQAHQRWSEVRLVGCDAERVLVWDDAAVGSGSAVAFVAPVDGFPPLLTLIEPEASSVETEVAADGSRTPNHDRCDARRGRLYQRVSIFILNEVIEANHRSDVG